MFDQDLGFAQGVEQLTIQQFIPEPGIEAFAVSILPGGSWLDVSCLGADGGDPIPHLQSNKFRPIVGPDVFRRTAQNEQIGQRIQYVR